MEAYVQRTNQKAQAMVVHRLDRDASGLLVLARNEKAYEHLKDLFSKHAIERRYIALVHGVFRNPQGKLEHLLFQDERGLVHVTKEGKAAQARRAAMTYKVLGATAKLTRVECTLETGASIRFACSSSRSAIRSAAIRCMAHATRRKATSRREDWPCMPPTWRLPTRRAGRRRRLLPPCRPRG